MTDSNEIFDALEREMREGCIPPPTHPMAVARRFIASHSVPLCCQDGTFYVYDGTCWPELDTAELRARVYKWTESASYVRGEKQLVVPWEPNRHRIRDVLAVLEAVAHLPVKIGVPSWLQNRADIDAKEIVAVRNGLLHFPTCQLLPHTPRFWSHHSLPFDYEPNSRVPSEWLAFLDQLWEDDTDAIDTLQEICGYVLSGSTRLQEMFLLNGPKRSGKGTFGRVLTGLLGIHNVAAPTLSSLSGEFGLAALIGKPLALISDARLSDRRDSSAVVERLLSISGEDMLSINRKYRDFWTGRIPSRFVILTNELPNLSDTSGAFASRFIVLRLTRSFAGREDPTLTDRLFTEAPGIFAWALEGLDRLTERGHFVQPDSGREALEELGNLGSPVDVFVRDRCEVGPSREVDVSVLYLKWTTWCEEQGYDRPGSVQTFGRDLRAVLPNLRMVRPRER